MNNLKKKIFITGISASGKTHLAKHISKEKSLPYIDFDAHWNFNILTPEYEDIFLKWLPNQFVIDAIPYTNNYLYFQKYREENDTTVICTVQFDLITWAENIINKNYFKLNSPYFKINFWDAWVHFYTVQTNNIKPDYYFNNSTNTLLTIEEFETLKIKLLDIIKGYNNKNQNFFKNYLDTYNPKLHDKKYQDIECIDFIGYSKSFETWNRIKDLVNWENKSVIDLGCYHGYFSFKAEQARANKVIGLEMWESVLKITKMIKHINLSKADFQIWKCGEETPIADIALVLNILHHAEDIEKTLQNINTKIAIFEIEKSQMESVKKYFTVVKEVASHRVGGNQDRIILLTEKL